MKNVIIIAFLLLGVAGCQTNDPMVETHRANTPGKFKIPPDVYCKECGTQFNGTPSGCINEANPGDYPLWTCIEMVNVPWLFFVHDSGNVLKKINHALSGPGSRLDSTKARFFFDEWLSQFPKGTDYVSHFYEISKCAHVDGIPLLDLPDHYDFGEWTIRVADSLQNGQWDCVPITPAYKSAALDMIEYYRGKCEDGHFQAALDSIESDLDLHAERTRAQIYDIYD